MTIPAIETQQLTKTYRVGFFGAKRVLALQGLNLKVEPGQVFGLLGPNGAGKSTMIKLLLDLIRPSGGTAKIFGAAPSDAEARRQIGFLPENPAPYEYLTGHEFVTLAGKLAGVPAGHLKQRVGEVLASVGMTNAKDLQIRRYSKGMTQRISLAQALVTQPKLLVLDEPTSGLDVLGRQLIRDVILEQRRLGTTVLLCSHIIPDVEALCDRVAVIVGGRLLREGRVADMLSAEGNASELTVEGLTEAHVKELEAVAQQVTKAGERWLVRCEEGKTQALLGLVLARGAKVVRLQPSRYSLEELFVKAVTEGGRSVGSYIE